MEPGKMNSIKFARQVILLFAFINFQIKYIFFIFQMVYNYKRKTDRAKWSEDNWKRVILEAGRTSILNGSRMYGIHYATLHRHVKSGCIEKKLGRFSTVFTQKKKPNC